MVNHFLKQALAVTRNMNRYSISLPSSTLNSPDFPLYLFEIYFSDTEKSGSN